MLVKCIHVFHRQADGMLPVIPVFCSRNKQHRERDCPRFMDKYPFAKTDPIIQDMENFMVGCDRRRDRIKEQVGPGGAPQEGIVLSLPPR